MITCNRKELIGAIERCSKVAPPKTTMPILGHALVEFSGSRLSYRATNTALSVAGEFAATGDPASFTVNPRDALNALGAVEGDDAKIDVGPGFIRISAKGKRAFKMPTLSAEDFPKAPESGNKPVTLKAVDLLAVIRGVAFAVAADNEERAQLKAVRVFRDGSKLTALAGNGYSAARCSVPASTDLDVVIPSSACRILLDSVDPKGDISISVGGILGFSWSGQSLYSAAPAERFPAVENAFGSRPANSAKLSAVALASAVAAVQRVDAERDVVLTFRTGTVTVESHGQGHGYACDELEAAYDGEPMQIGLAAQYLSAALAAADDDLTVYFTDNQESYDPFVLESEGWVGVIMPLRPETLRSKGKL